VEEEEHREHPAVVVGSRRQIELSEDAVHVRLDGLRAEHELLADASIRAPFGHELQDLALAAGQLLERIVLAAAADQLPDHLGVDRRSSAADAAHGLEELVDLEHSVLEQVPEAFRPIAEEIERV